MYLYLLLGGLINTILIGLFGRFIGRQAVLFSTILTYMVLIIILVLAADEILFHNYVINITAYNFFSLQNVQINFGLLYDQLTIIMLSVILSISLFVHLFTVSYMSHDPFIVRFYTFLGFFTFFMQLLVTADNFIQLFMGWEGVGVCSYLLINFWFNRIEANKAAIKAMLMNRIADVFFLFGIVLILYQFKTVNYLLVFSIIEAMVMEPFYIIFKSLSAIDLILFFLVIGAMGKSAQIGLHTWLPDAMEGPTPVSALLHAATMVTAGVFLLIRCSFILENSNIILALIIVVGVCTALFSAIVATFQYDLKKIIAYSTCSQLGYMFFSSGLSNYNITLFHLFNHAFFKALLFLGAGSIISALSDEQDIRRLGSLIHKLPLTYIAILIGSMAILGFPFLTGFYSKDLILELAYTSILLDSTFVYNMAVLTAFFTAIYSFKLIFFVFIIKTNNYNRHLIIFEKEICIILTLLSLSILSVSIGFITAEIFTGIGSAYISNSIFYNIEKFDLMGTEFIHPLIKNFPFIFTILGLYISYLTFMHNFLSSSYYNFIYDYKKKIYIFFYNAGFFNNLYNKIFLWVYKKFYYIFVCNLEKGFFEFFGPFGVYILAKNLSLNFRYISPYTLTSILLLIYAFMIILILFIILDNLFFIKSIYIIILIYVMVEESINSKK